MRKLLTGAVNNAAQHMDKILLWNNSFKRVCDGEVILVSINTSEDDRKALEHSKIKFVEQTTESTETINNSRIFIMGNFLTSVVDDYDVALYTDVFDVAFTRDPFKQLDLYNYSVFVAGEGVTHGEEPWNMDVMSKCFVNQPQRMRHKEVFCSGVIAGKPRALANFIHDIWLTLLKSAKGHDIADQAAMNLNVHTNPSRGLKKFYIYDKWCLHMATGGPTEFFEKWGFKSAIERKYGPIPNMREFAILHQFNRIPEIHNFIIKHYG